MFWLTIVLYRTSDSIFAARFRKGDPGAVSRVRRKGGTKVFKYWRKSPWVPGRIKVTDSHRNIFKNSSGCRLLIGHKKCFVLLYPIGEQFHLSSFHEFVHDGYCVATLARFVHQACVVCARKTFIFYFPNEKRRNYQSVETTFGVLSAGAIQFAPRIFGF